LSLPSKVLRNCRRTQVQQVQQQQCSPPRLVSAWLCPIATSRGRPTILFPITTPLDISLGSATHTSPLIYIDGFTRRMKMVSVNDGYIRHKEKSIIDSNFHIILKRYITYENLKVVSFSYDCMKLMSVFLDMVVPNRICSGSGRVRCLR
jgi:hypothetical protein